MDHVTTYRTRDWPASTDLPRPAARIRRGDRPRLAGLVGRGRLRTRSGRVATPEEVTSWDPTA